MSDKNSPILLVMAAGMGSRYGGLKQIDPVGGHSQLIIDYSIYDAKQAGFDTVVFVITKALEQDFRSTIGKRLEGQIEVRYAFQSLEALPEGYTVPEGRVKPWGTAQAILMARDIIDRPFAVINADDYYGPEAFRLIHDALVENRGRPDREQYAMVGYRLENTVTENGHVARGVCQVDKDNVLVDIRELTRIQCFDDGIKFTEDDGATWQPLQGDDTVSMNFWGFPAGLMGEIAARFPAFLDKALATDPMKGEYYIPVLVGELVQAGKARVRVLYSHDKWHGVTYQADKQEVVDAIAAKTAQGQYPENLWK